MFKNAIAQRDNQLARIHGIWGIGQLIDQDGKYAVDLITAITDADEEIGAQAIKVLGDRKVAAAGNVIQAAVGHINPRKSFFAAQAIGRIKHQPAQDDLVKLLIDNADNDVYLRHAAVLALSRLGNIDYLAKLSSHTSRSARIGGVLALRRLKSPEIKVYLQDPEEYIVTEAARAINDDESIPGALSDLANLVNQTKFKSEPLLRRAINACLRVGEPAQLDMLIAFAQRKDVSNSLRAEAMSTIGSWADPSVLDRVDGRYRGEFKRDAEMVKGKILPILKSLMSSKDPDVLMASTRLISELNLIDYATDLEQLFSKNDSADVRVAALNALNQLKFSGLDKVIASGMKDKSPKVRAASLGLLNKIEISEALLAQTVKDFMAKGSPREQQRLMEVLGKLPLSKTEPILNKLIDDLAAKKLPADLTLELNEAVEATKSASLKEKLKSIQAGDDPK